MNARGLRLWHRQLIAIILIANYHPLAWTTGHSDAKNAPLAACLAATEVSPLHLYGLWRAEWPADAGRPAVRATLLFEKHAEFAQSLSGGIRREGTELAGPTPPEPQLAQVAGDVEDGEFNLEESANGRDITAVWTGRVVEASCGKEITGTWTAINPSTTTASTPEPRERPFVLRKRAGWQ